MDAAGSTQNALLGLLTICPMSGYDIRQLVPWSIGHFWNESYGQIYPSLKRLAEAGLIAKMTESRPGRPERNVYSLTEAGRTELCRWLEMPVVPTVARNELLLKVFFGAHAGGEIAEQHVLAFAEQQRAAQDVYAATVKKLTVDSAGDPQLPFWLMTLNYGRHQSVAALAWCQETLAALEELKRARAETV